MTKKLKSNQTISNKLKLTMVSNAGYGLSVFFGLFAISFGLQESVTIYGNVSSYSAATEICKKHGQRLISLEGYKMTNVSNFMEESGIHSVWLNAEYKMLNHWTFTDPGGTILEDEYIDISQGGSCGAYGTEDNRFKSFPCNQAFDALKIEGSDSAVTFYYDVGQEQLQSWFLLNKSILATPPSNSTVHLKPFQSFKQYVHGLKIKVPLKEYYWVGLNKFEFLWPDGTKVPLNKLSWQDGSPNEQCLIFSYDGNEGSLKVVDCEAETTRQILCIPETDGGYPKWQWITFYILLGVVLVLSVVFIAICMPEKKKKLSINPTTNLQHHGNSAIRENILYANTRGAGTSIKRPLPERPAENIVIMPQIGEDKVNYEEVDVSAWA